MNIRLDMYFYSNDFTIVEEGRKMIQVKDVLALLNSEATL